MIKLNKEEQKSKLLEYTHRHDFWEEQALTQFGFATNLFLTLNVAFIAFLMSRQFDYPSFVIDCSQEINGGLLLFIIAFILSMSAITAGLVCVISRLYDLRITRHIVWARKWYMKKKATLISEDYLDLTKHSCVGNFIKTVTGKLGFIPPKYFEDHEKLTLRFNQLRLQAKLLGSISWKAFNFQVVCSILSGGLYLWSFIII